MKLLKQERKNTRKIRNTKKIKNIKRIRKIKRAEADILVRVKNLSIVLGEEVHLQIAVDQDHLQRHQ